MKLCHNSAAKINKSDPYKLQLFGMRHLLELRGLTNIDIMIPTHPYCHLLRCNHIRPNDRFHYIGPDVRLASSRDAEIMIERLQVTKQPRDEKELKRLARKDRPRKRSKGRSLRETVRKQAPAVTTARHNC